MRTSTVLCMLVLSSAAASPVPRISQDEAVKYLTRYGYLSEKDNALDQDTLSTAISSLQQFFKLTVTGELDRQTIELMRTPRCGVIDIPPARTGDHRKRRYVLTGDKWGIKNIKYRILSFPTQGPLTQNEVRNIMAQAFALWAAVAPLKFIEQRSGKPAHLDILFAKGEHGDGDPFDGRGNVLAHALQPTFSGHTHFDDDEYFTQHSHRGIDLLNTAAHEFGHALGLKHSKTKGALMYPNYVRRSVVQLESDDIQGIQAIYGKRTRNSESDVKEAIKGKPNAKLCKDPRPDMMYSQKSQLFAIKNNSLYELVEGGVAPGYPKPIHAVWPELPHKIDSVVVHERITIFFSGSNIYLYKDDKFYGEPAPLSALFRGMPGDCDAVGTWNGFFYFFKGDLFWKFDVVKAKVTEDSPKPLSSIKGYDEEKVDSILIHSGKLFFIAGDQHYLVDPVLLEVPDLKILNYPQKNAFVFFGCS